MMENSKFLEEKQSLTNKLSTLYSKINDLQIQKKEYDELIHNTNEKIDIQSDRLSMIIIFIQLFKKKILI